MACGNIVGVKNIKLDFTHCATGEELNNYAHKLATDELPKIRIPDHKAEKLPGGYTRRHESAPIIEMKVIRNPLIPLKWYQGDASISVQIEYENGLVYTAKDGTVEGEEMSDSHEVNLRLIYRSISELLPDGGLASAA